MSITEEQRLCATGLNISFVQRNNNSNFRTQEPNIFGLPCNKSVMDINQQVQEAINFGGHKPSQEI